MSKKLLKRGNHKLSSKQGIWTLPRSTCIGAGKCKNFCYAKKMEVFENVRKSRAMKLSETKKTFFCLRMVKEIIDRNLKVIRIHESGDFYSQEYFNKWRTIANTCPDVTFYAFTKAFELDFSKAPENLVIIQSYGSKYDEKINPFKNTSRVVEKEDEINKGEYLCPYGKSWFSKCGEICAYCYSDYPEVKHVVFLRH